MKAQLKVGDELYTREQVEEMLNKQKTFCDTSVLKNLSIQFPTPAMVITDEPILYKYNKTKATYDSFGVEMLVKMFNNQYTESDFTPLWTHPPIDKEIDWKGIEEEIGSIIWNAKSHQSGREEVIEFLKSKLTKQP